MSQNNYASEYRVSYLHIGFKYNTPEDIDHMISRMMLKAKPELYNKFIRSDDNPDYVIATDKMNRTEKLYNRMLDYIQQDKARNKIFIFYTYEPLEPDFNLFDYAVSFNRDLKFGDRLGPCVNFLPYDFENKKLLENNVNIKAVRENLNNLKFCCFIHSHWGSPRDEFFHELSRYKRVDSLGKHLNNMSTRTHGFTDAWMEKSINMKSNYKFSFAFENTRYKYYTTEKILTAMQAHTVPIYWGDPAVTDLYNPEAFINCNDCKNLDEMLEKVREVDNDDELFLHMISQPWQTPDQQNLTLKLINDYYNFIENIFTQDIRSAKRVPFGIIHDIYVANFAGVREKEPKAPDFWGRWRLRIKNFPNKIKNILGINKNKDKNN